MKSQATGEMLHAVVDRTSGPVGALLALQARLNQRSGKTGSMDYRPDIEGMRALAIVLVVAAHVAMPGFEGGFVGVDVFFVISGYLISGLLIDERSRTGRIDLAAFYARRFRRLLPALLLMLAVTAIAAGFSLQPSAQSYQAQAGAAASVWASNLYFAFGKIDYFDPSSESNTYLHTWSLGVEEQFYLVWPLLLLVLVRPAKTSQWSGVAWGMGMLLVASLAACIWMMHVSARFAFYLMPLRAWQFASGALAYTCSANLSRDGGRKGGGRIAEALGAGGIVLVFSAVVLTGNDTAYPGTWAVLPTLGTVLLLLAGSAGNPVVSRLLSLPPMQALGKISYGWYLWHWPALVLGAALVPGPSLAWRLCFVLVASVFATMSYLWVEHPIRRTLKLICIPRRFILVSLLTMLTSTLLFERWSETAQQAAVRAETSAKARAGGMPIIYSMGCDDWYYGDVLKPCVFGAESAPKVAVAIGDSIGLQWFPAYAKVFSGPQWKLVVLTKSSCPMVDEPIFNSRIGREYTECAIWRNKALDYIAELRPDIVIMGSTHAANFNRRQWIDGTNRVLARIAPFADEIRIMRSTPLLPFNGPECAWSHPDKVEMKGAARVCAASAADDRNDEVAAWLGQVAAGWKNVDMLDMNDAVCPQGICRAVRNGVLTYRDQQHMTAEYAESMAGQLQAKLGSLSEKTKRPATSLEVP